MEDPYVYQQFVVVVRDNQMIWEVINKIDQIEQCYWLEGKKLSYKVPNSFSSC